MTTIASRWEQGWDEFKAHFVQDKQLATKAPGPAPPNTILHFENEYEMLDAEIKVRDTQTKELLKEMVQMQELWKDVSHLA